MKVLDLRQNEKNTKDAGVADLETAIRLTKVGKFHIFLIGVGGFSFLCSGLEYGLHAYVLPYAQCDLNIGTSEMGIINAMFLGGSILCSFIWGTAADTLGRKKVLVIAMTLDAIATFIASWSPSYIMFAFVRFFSGFMCGAPGCLATSYVGEFCSDKFRSRGICFIGFCWTAAWLLLPAIAWIIIPSSLFFQTPIMEYSTWRVFVALVAMPNLIGAVTICYFLTETPKFLFVQGRQEEAIDILKMMYHKNTGNPPESYPVNKLVAKFSDLEENSNKVDVKEKIKPKKLSEILLLMYQQTKQLFHPPHLNKMILASSIYFANFFGYYGLGLWLPELFNRFEVFYAEHPNETISVCELTRYNSSIVIPEDDIFLMDDIDACDSRAVNLAVFSNTFIIGAVCCLGNILAIILTNKVGGRLLSLWASLLAGTCAIVVYFSRSQFHTVVITCLFMSGAGTAMITIGSCVVNLFPTSIRAMGVCIGILFGRLGAVCSNLIFGMLLDISCEVPIFLLGGTVIFGGLLCLLLPKNSQKAVE